MRRRDFIAGLAGATAWPIAAGAQQPDDLAKGWWLWSCRLRRPTRPRNDDVIGGAPCLT